MSKIKIKQIDNQLIIKVKLEKSEEINQRDIEVFDSKHIRGITRPKIVKNNKLEYLIPGNITLNEFIRSGITKNDFYVIFAQIIECIKKAERNSFNINNFIFDSRYIFFNKVTKEVQFIYIPIVNGSRKVNIFSFIYELLATTIVALSENRVFLDEIMSFVRSVQTFSTIEFEKFIIRVYPQVYKQVRRSEPGDSQYLKHTGWNYYAEKYNSKGNVDIDETNILIENQDFEETGLLSETDEYEETGLLVDEDEEETTCLSGNEGTGLYERKEIRYPYLIRLNTYEKISVDKPVYRIGKEKSYVDYFVMSNNAVSRVHADILTENNRYFIKDNNSTNHTFVNGTMISQNVKTEIFDGDAIMLANEPFEFHID